MNLMCLFSILAFSVKASWLKNPLIEFNYKCSKSNSYL